jgi:hypothetical protein
LHLEPISRRERLEDILYRNSYRAERVSADEAVHKLHFETFVVFDQGTTAGSRKMLLHVVYQIVLHLPVGYSLREVRVIATHDNRLTKQQLEALQFALIDFFINGFLDERERLDHRTDSLIHLRSPRHTRAMV